MEKEYYFLTWTAGCCHDMDEWVAITADKNELITRYRRELEENGEEYRGTGAILKVYKYTAMEGFKEKNIKGWC